MKSLLMVAAMMLGSVAMAQDATPAAPAKVSHKEAKAECLKGDKTLKGKKLNECIKEKTGKK